MRISSILFTVLSAVVIGPFIVIALVMGFDTAKPVMMIVGFSFFAGMPITWVLVQKLHRISALN